jgi:RNA polymerase sigma-70 factor (ECF subfamily)
MTAQDKLIQRCRQGDLGAFGELFRAHEARVYRLAITILHDERDAEDAVQDVFVRVFEHIQDYRGTSAFNTWLTAIVVNRCRDKLRRRRLRQALSLDRLRGRASAHDPSELVARRQQRQSLWALVERLDDKYRLPVILHYYEGLPCDEVAFILSLRTSTIYSRLNTARTRLRAMLQDQSDSKGKEVNRKACARGSVEKET